MNQMNLDEAIDGAGRRLHPDVDRIVDSAITAGARQVRRRRRGTAMAVAATVAAVGVGGGWWLQRPSTDDTTVADPSLFAAGPDAGSRQRADADEIRDRFLELLPDGEVSDVEVREDPSGTAIDGTQPGIEVTLRLDGTPVRLNLIDFHRDTDKVRAEWSTDPGPRPEGCQASTRGATLGEHSTAAERDCAQWNELDRMRDCAQAPSCADLDDYVAYSPQEEVCHYADHIPCREVGDGSWIAAGVGGDHPASGSPFTMANLFTADGWYVYASSDNEPTAVLSLDEITAIVTNDAWFA